MFKMNLKKWQGFFKKKFSNESKKQDMNDILKKIYESSDIWKLNTDIVVGKPVTADNRILYPLSEISSVGNGQQFRGAKISPIAILVEEPDNEYLFSLADREINPEELIEKISPKEKHEEAVIKLLKRISG